MSIQAKIVAHSISEAGKEIVTYELEFPRFELPHLLTHRAISKNSSSSRAIPCKKQIKDVWDNMATPIHWGKNQPGMSATEELKGWRLKAAKFIWKLSGKTACVFAYIMAYLGLHKQASNRLLECFSHVKIVATATDWDNFFFLRAHKDAQPEIQELAYKMLAAYKESKPKLLKSGEWHLPYVNDFSLSLEDSKILSASLCAQVSYRKFDDSMDKAWKIYEKLFGGEVKHLSPVEHQATPLIDPEAPSGNLKGWLQLRQTLKNNVCNKYDYK